MATSNKTPVVIPQPIAAQATSQNINVIPNGATGTNRASFQEGFPAITRMPVIENPLPTQVSGLPPKQQDFNGLFNVVSQHNFFAQNGGLYSFNQAVSDAIGGYAKNQILWYFPATGLPYPVVSMIDNNTYNFVETPSYIDGEKWNSIVANASLDNLNATGQAKFDAKANTDASNFTATGKQNIVSFLMVDYTTGIEVPLTGIDTFTAPYDCEVYYRSGLQNNAQERLVVNGAVVGILEGNLGFVRSTLVFKMSKDDVLSGLAANDVNRNSGMAYFRLKGR